MNLVNRGEAGTFCASGDAAEKQTDKTMISHNTFDLVTEALDTRCSAIVPVTEEPVRAKKKKLGRRPEGNRQLPSFSKPERKVL